MASTRALSCLLSVLCVLYLDIVLSQPSIQQELRYSISEELSDGTFIADLRSDANMEGRHAAAELLQVKFRFLSPPKVSFHMEEETGVLRTGQQIDRDVECPGQDVCEYILDVVALIPSSMTFLDVIKVKVVIRDLNDNWPVFPETAISHDILESATLGTSIVVPTATDPDSSEFGIKDYILEGEMNPFELKLREKLDGSIEVRLILKTLLDREQKDQYRMKVIARDGGDKEGSIDVRVRVLDSNDNEPRFDNVTYEVSIFENIPVQTTILRVHAADPDNGDYGRVIYGFSPQTLNSYHHLFGIDEATGDLYISGSIDFEEGSVYHLFVTAHDQGPDTRTSDTTVIVRVKDVNDHAPQIKVNTLAATSTDSAEVSEDASLETFVAHLTVTDPDSGNNGKFNCSLNDSHFQLQQMYQSEYKIITRALLDRELRSEYNLAITCKDRGQEAQVSIKHVKVVVADVNDNPPVFSQNSYAANLIENNLVGTYITQVNATDSDQGVNAAVAYNLEASVRSLFSIDPSSGIITTRVIFDHEQTGQIQFHVTAVDRGEPAMSATVLVIVSVLDVNDERPEFSQHSYSFGVYENEPPGSEVGIVHAVDADSEPYSHFELAFLPGGTSDDNFAINPHTGKITTRTTLDREQQGVYHLVVMAMDKGAPPMTSTVTVSVYVADQNDNSPVFTYPTQYNNTVHISNQSPVGYRVARIQASDLDIGKNSNLTYYFQTGNEKGDFVVNAITGSVMVNTDLQVITYQMYNLVVIAKDAGVPEQTSIANLNIVVNKSIGYLKKESHIMIGQNFTIVISLACVSGLVVVILVLAIICIRRQDSSRHQHKQKHHPRHMAKTPTSHDQLTVLSKVPNGGLENSACVKSQDDVKIIMSGPERKNSKRSQQKPAIKQQQQQTQQQQRPEISLVTPAHSSAMQCSASSLNRKSGHSQPQAETGAWALAQKELEVHQLLHLLKKDGDADSTSSGEGSNTDSGRGPSEEGDRDHNHSRDSQGGRRAERAAAAAARAREAGSGGPPPQRATPSAAESAHNLNTGTATTGPGQGQSYFRDGTQMTTFNPRGSLHRDPRDPRHLGAHSQPTPGVSKLSLEGVYHATPVRLQQSAPVNRTYPSGSSQLGGQRHQAGGGGERYQNHRGLPSSRHDVGVHSSRSRPSSSSFRPNDVPLRHSTSRDDVVTLQGAESYSKDVVV